jgi:hypothetical protein
VKDQWERFKKGMPPKDESKFKGYLGEAGILGGEWGKEQQVQLDR